ncbi:MAG: hypothetical protein M4579_000261 [Chaenotheca gracillima]|nr:MAG: hypothetical protein M4579_000261 [Chaenotheca gracillima]
MASDLSHTALVVIDVQKAFDHPTHWGNARSNPKFEENLTSLLYAFRTAQDVTGKSPLLIHVYHNSEDSSSPLHHTSAGHEFMDYAAPLSSEPTIGKSVNSSFIGTDLEKILRENGIRQLYLAGLSTDHCVSTTTRMAANLHVTDHVDDRGIKQRGHVILIEDATAAWEKGGFDAEIVHRVNVESLKEFADIAQTRDVLASLRI